MNEITPLMRAARAGSVEDMRQLMDRGNPLNVTDDRGRSALHYAVEANQHGSLRVLLEADPGLATLQDSDGRNVLHLATVAGEVELMKELIKHVDIDSVDNEEHTAVHFATVSGLYNCIELLIENGADPALPDQHGAYPVHYAAQMCGEPSTFVTGIKCLQALLVKGGSHVNCKDDGGKTPLLWAASAGSAQACKLLVERGADVNLGDKDGLTAVHCASSRNKSTCLKTLLVDCNCKADQADNNGCTPLFYAIMMDHHRCVKMLLKHGASPSWQDSSGKSPVHCAASKGSVRYLKMLKKHRGHLELPTSTGDRPIHEAARAGQNDAVRFLMKRGDGVNARNNEGLTVLHIAAETDNLPLCKELVNKGADISAVYSSSKSNQVTAGTLASEKGCESCAEYLQYVQEQGIQPDTRIQNSSSSNESSASSSSSEDEKEDSEQEKNNDADKEEKKRKERDDEIWRELAVKTPNTNNNNSPNMSSVEDEKTKQDGATTSDGVNDAGVGSGTQGNNSTDKQEGRDKPEEKKVKKKKVAEQRDSETPVSNVSSWDPDRLERKIAAWDVYLRENVEFLDRVIGSKAPELEETRHHAKVEMKTLVEKLETLKKEVDDRCHQLVHKMSEREEQRKKEYEDLLKNWKETEDKFKTSHDKIDSAVSDYRSKNKALEAWLDEIEAAERKERDTSQNGTDSAQQSKAPRRLSEPIVSDSEKARRARHKAWLREKEANYQKRKQDVHLKLVFEHTVESLRAKRAQSAHSSMSRNFNKTNPSSPLSPRLNKSPFSKRTVDQCPVYRKSPSGSSNGSDSITSYDKAQLRRSIGDKLNQKMYPKSWEMPAERQDHNETDVYIPRWDGGKRPKHRLEFTPRTPQSRQSAEEHR